MKIANYVEEGGNAPGTQAAVTLTGAPADRITFYQAFGANASVGYFIDDGAQAEWGEGLVAPGPPATITRSTVIGNTAGTTARLNFTGAVRVYSEAPAERLALVNAAGVLPPGSAAEPLHSQYLSSAAQSFTSGTYSTFNWDSRGTNTLGAMQDGNRQSLVAPYDGLYCAIANIGFSGNQAGTTRIGRIVMAGFARASLSQSASAGGNDMSLAATLHLAAGNPVSVAVFHDAGGPLLIGNNTWTNFSLILLGR